MERRAAFDRCIEALTAEFPSMSIGAKYLLVRSICVFGDKPSEDTREQLASKIGMPVKALIEAHNELQRLGFAGSSSVPGYSRKGPTVTTQGGFRRGFKLSMETLDGWLDGSKMMSTGARIRMVLRMVLLWPEPVETGAVVAGMEFNLGSSSHPPLPEGIRLSFANRLLMGVLLANSDEFGIVWNCSPSKLSKLTGMSRGQVESQLGKLTKAKMISSRAPAAIGDAFFPKLPGGILLNLYPELTEATRPAEPALFTYWTPAYDLGDVVLLLGIAQSARHNRIGLDAREYVEQALEWRLSHVDGMTKRSIEEIADQAEDFLAAGLYSGAARRFALYKLCEFATQILQKAESVSPHDPMIQRIGEEIMCPKLHDGPSFLGVGALFIFYAQRLAGRVKQSVEQAGCSIQRVGLFPGPAASMSVLIRVFGTRELNSGQVGKASSGRWILSSPDASGGG